MTCISRLRIPFITVALLLALSPLRANKILEMANEAETIVIGEGVVDDFQADAPIEFNVRADTMLKGKAALGSSLKAVYPKPDNCCVATGQINFERLAPPSGSYGLWFFQGDINSYVRLPKSWVVPKGVSVEQLLLMAVVESYRQSISDADLIRRGEPAIAKRRMNNSLQYARRFGAEDIALKVVEELMESASGEEFDIALAVGIGMSHDPALVRFGADLESLRLDAGILSALENSYTPTQGTAPLENLIRANQKARVAGLDSALAGALRRVPHRAMLPLAALLLDSPDEMAVRRAAGYFHVYTVLAREDGSVSSDGTDSGLHPYRSAETQAHNGHDETLPASAHADFWRDWWADRQQPLTP